MKLNLGRKKISNLTNKFLIILTVVLVSSSSFKMLYATALEEYQKQYQQIKEAQQATTSQLKGVDKEISQDTYDMITLDEKITEFSIKLEEIQSKYNEVTNKLDEQEKALQEASQEFDGAEQIYVTRLRVIYENGIPSIIDVLLSSKGISDFFSKLNVISGILEYDKSLVKNIKSQKDYIDYINEDIKIQKVTIEQLKYDVEKSTTALENARIAKENKMQELQSSKQNLKEKMAALASQEAAMAKKIDEENARLRNLGGTFNGQFAWPVPRYTYITTMFNVKYDPWGVGVSTLHTGLDIAGSGIFGKPIVSMESGVVSVASYGWNGGYGNYIQVDHGKSAVDGAEYRTLYGHCSSLAVSKGQTVKKGQVIGYVGSTGNSTGPHVHLEVRKNNVKVNPLLYFKGMTITYNGRTYAYQ